MSFIDQIDLFAPPSKEERSCEQIEAANEACNCFTALSTTESGDSAIPTLEARLKAALARIR
ncbi:hypothetical protein KKF55_03465 [Patescibacteria group bacterium]|nr:hypothetical protein [Patescibacteria group bacterium]